MQDGLAIYGFNVLACSYDPFGIIMSELEVGLPTLLFYDYFYFFMDPFIPVSQIPVLGGWVTALWSKCGSKPHLAAAWVYSTDWILC